MAKTLEGLRASTFVDKTFATGSGYTIENKKKAIALPYNKALKKWVRLTLPSTGLSTVVQVLDVGPYLWWDADFILKGKRPMAEWFYENNCAFPSVTDGHKRWGDISFAGKVPTSRASVDLTPPVWWDLGVDKTENELRSFSVDDMIMEWFVPEPVILEDNEEDEMPDWLKL